MTDTYTVLVADDDASITDIIKTELETEGYNVLTAKNGDQAVDIVKTGGVQLVIMDVMMPVCNGILATVKIRELSNIPVLMLSAKAEGSDRVLGLEAGADDYLVKPFYRIELLARVKALLRRYAELGSINAPAADRLTVGDVSLDLNAKNVSVRGEATSLTATEFKILHLFMANPGRVFSAEEIYERIWDNEAYSVENSVMVHISRIRQKIEIDPKHPEYLKVKWGIGYVFEKKS